MLGQLQSTAAELGRSANQRVDVELCLIRLCDETVDDSAAGLNARLSRVEELLANGAMAAGGGEKPAVGPMAEERRQVAADRPAPPAAEDLPPWEADVPLPEAPEEEGAGEAIPVAAEEPAAAPSVPEAAPAPQLGDFWPGMVAGLKGRIPMGEYSFLSNPTMVQGRVDGPVLTLWAQNDFVRNMISKPGILAAIGKAANLLPGGPYRVTVTVGTPPAPAVGEHDKLDDLLALGQELGGIITEE